MHWQSPNFYAYFPSAFSFPSLLGDLMSSALSVNGFLWVSSPAATELETVGTSLVTYILYLALLPCPDIQFAV